jgi:pyochelin biosynthesis protein PchG
MSDESWRPRVVVCGTGFGRTYLAGLRRPGLPVELVGILARGSERSHACARHYEVPLYTDPDQLPSTVDIACVVVSSGLNGGRGAELAQRLMERDIHILQEHPLHHTELANCLRQARRRGVVYHINTHYVHVEAVARFIRAARALLAEQRPAFIDAVTGFQVLYPLLDILGRALGGLRPWSLTGYPATGTEVLRTVDGTLAGVPATLRIQNQLQATEKDNGAHVMHRVTLATEGGDLLLANTHGPVLWSPRLHMPPDYPEVVTIGGSVAEELDLPSAACLSAAAVPTYRTVIGQEWPDAVARAVLCLRRTILAGEDGLSEGQYQLAVSRLFADITGQLGRPQLVSNRAPRILEAYAVVTGARGEPATGRWDAASDQEPSRNASASAR